MSWILLKQECTGTYKFSGAFYITKGVLEIMTREEALTLLAKAQERAKDGADYLQVFLKHGQKLFLIDNLNQEMVDSGDYSDEDNYCTLMRSDEY